MEKTKADVVIGTYCGDEGKGKTIDLLATEADIAVRATGGDNAGHSVDVKGKKYALHILPCGILSPHVTGVIGNGVMVNPLKLINELMQLEASGFQIMNKDITRLKLSHSANLIMPYYIDLDMAMEEARKNKIGTTMRGIGPGYMYKAARDGFRVGDLFHEDFAEHVKHETEIAKKLMDAYTGVEDSIHYMAWASAPHFDADIIIKDYMRYADMLKPFVCDTAAFLHHALEDGKKVVIEGAQAALLDIDHGTSPFVTSSNPTIGGILSGTGLSASDIGNVYGITKAYASKVGAGPFPTRLDNETGDMIRKLGHEYGVTTGRPRDCGWLDLVALKYAKRINGITGIVLNHLDTIGKFPEFGVCTAYKADGTITYDYFTDINFLQNAEPVLKMFEGWTGEDISGMTEYELLPENAKKFIEFVEYYIGVPIVCIGTGAGRDDVIRREI